MFRRNQELRIGSLRIRESTPTRPSPEVIPGVDDTALLQIPELESEPLAVQPIERDQAPVDGSLETVRTTMAPSEYGLTEAAQAFRRRYETLTDREREVATFFSSGQTAEDIGKVLFINSSTVKTHRDNIYRKLAVSDRFMLLRSLIAAGLLGWEATVTDSAQTQALSGSESKPSLSRKSVASFKDRVSKLAPREREILSLFCVQDRPPQEIAGRLNISPQTVEKHLHNVYKKLAVSGRVRLLYLLSAAGLIDRDLNWSG